MIVSELIKILETLPQDKIALARGYESGFNEIRNIQTLELVKCDNEHAWWDGDYQDVGGMYGKPIDTPKEYICLQ